MSSDQWETFKNHWGNQELMKCDICAGTIRKTFLDKVLGTFIGKGKKRKVVCFECQARLKTKEEIEKALPQ